MASIKVYSTPTCPFCKRAKEFLKQNNFAFEDLNVAESEEIRTEMINNQVRWQFLFWILMGK